MTQAPIVRFAPSPTGRLHIGNIRTAMFNWLFAQSATPAGQYVLRLDDTDTARSTEEFAQGIVDDLTWLGIVPGRTERQSARVELHDAAAQKLRDVGLLYACYETPDEIDRKRKRLMARGRPPVYDRAGLLLSDSEKAAFEAEGRKPHWRFLLPNFDGDPSQPHRTEVNFDDVFRGRQTVDLASMSDPVLVREDGTYLYTLPSVVDDLDMGITHVLRGGDHIANTGAQIALMRALGAEALPAFGHHNLLTGADGEGLSKRTGALSVAELREKGMEPMAVAIMSTLTGTDRDIAPIQSLPELARTFSGASVSKSPARFDPTELEALNERLLHTMPYETASKRFGALGIDVSEAFWLLARENLAHFDDITAWTPIVNGEIEGDIADDDRDFLAQAGTLLPAEPWPDTVWQDWTASVKAKTGRKGGALFMPLRKALTGRKNGPDMASLLPLIGRERTIRRLF